MRERVSLLVLLSLLWPLSLRGQQAERWNVGGSVRATLLVGDASEFLAGDVGAAIHAARRLRSGLGLRADVTYLSLHETTDSGERVDNQILGLGLGPDLSSGAGRVAIFLRPFARVVGNFRGGGEGAGAGGTDWTVAFGAAAGLRLRFGRLTIDLAGEVARMGELEFARVSTFSGPPTEEGLGALSLELGLGVALR